MAMTLTLLPKRAGGKGFTVAVTVDVSAAAYAIGDSVGTGGVAIPNTNGPVRLDSIEITEVTTGGVKPPITLYFFNANPSASTFTDSSAATIHANDAAKKCGEIEVAAGDYKYPDTNEPTGAQLSGIGHPMSPAAGTNQLYLAIMADGVWTPGTSSMTMKLNFTEV